MTTIEIKLVRDFYDIATSDRIYILHIEMQYFFTRNCTVTIQNLGEKKYP